MRTDTLMAMTKRKFVSIALIVSASLTFTACSKKYTKEDFCQEAAYSRAVVIKFSSYVNSNKTSIDSRELVKRLTLVKKSMNDLDKSAPDEISATVHNLHVSVEEVDNLFEDNDYDLAAIFKDEGKKQEISKLFKNFNNDLPKVSEYTEKNCKQANQ